MALGITKENILYGVATDGNLYSIDAKTAKETLVGPTGVKLLYSDGTWNTQSGEIDQNTNIFYWACTDNTTSSALYTIDLTNGHATKVGDFAGNEQMALLSLPEETVNASAPSLAANFSASFDKAALTGSVNFTIPSTTYYGDELAGKVSYVVSIDGNAVKSGEADTGKSVTEQITTERGMHQFEVVCSNASGVGPRAYFSKFVGDDTPLKPSNVKVALDASTGNTTITWEAVTKGKNGGYVGTVTYDVVRYPDKKVVAENTTETSAKDILPSGELTGYYYTVTAKSDEYKSDEAKSNSVTFGDKIEPPYHEGFDTESALNLYTIVDANDDGNTWTYCADDSYGQPAVKIEYGSYDHDDWIITPPISLKAGAIYNVTYRVASKGTSYPEILEVKYGEEPTAEAMVNILSEQTEITNKEYATVKKELTVTKDGAYYIGFHCTSSADWCYQLLLDDITVTGNSVKAPDVATSVNVVPALDGKTEATVSFVAPTTAIDGSQLSSPLNINIIRDGETIHTMENVDPGKTCSYTDTKAKNGFNNYSVVAVNEDGTGREAKATSVYVGIDTPDEVSGAKASTTSSSISFDWNPVTKGENGGYVDPSDIYYNVYDIFDTGMGAQLTLIDQVDDTHISIPYDTNSGEQEMRFYALSAENSLGEGPRSMTPGVLVGKPYTYPFEEHFTGGGLDNAMWWISSTGNSTYQLVQGVSADGDSGCAGYFSTADGDSATLGSGKLSLNGAKNPKFVFSHMSTSATAGGKVTVYIGTEKEEKVLCTVDYSKIDNSAKDWATTSADIDSKYLSEPYVTFKFVTTAPSGETVYFDRISLRDVTGTDLGIQLDVPAKAHKGDIVTANVTVNNVGANSVEGCTVNLYADGKLVNSNTIDESIAPYASAKLQLTHKTSVMDENVLNIKAEVVTEGDIAPDNNIAAADIQLERSTKTSPDNVKATVSGSSVLLTWDKIIETSETVTDGFESYAPWSMDAFGDWTAVYGEKGLAKGPFSRSYPHPNEGQRFAYTVAEPATWLDSQVLDNYTCLNPHAGNHYLATFYSVENSQFIPADNWLISPSLTGDKQTISFWANNFTSKSLNYPEDFDVLYSVSGTSLTDFKPVAQKLTADGGVWKEYTVELPEGSTYFAIHNNTYDTYMFMVDDVTYTAGCGKVVAYNIYRDGKQIAVVSADSNDFTDTTAESGEHQYAVSAVYAGGESEATPANTVTGINGIVTDDRPSFNIYTVDGKIVTNGAKSLNNLPKGLYIVNDKKQVVK